MSARKSERLVNLLIALLSTRRYLTRQELRELVEGYRMAPSDAAFERQFERDKEELRASGIVIEAARGVGTAVVDGRVTPDCYRVDPEGTVGRPGVGGVLDDDDLTMLVALGRRVTALLGAEQDIEWAIADGTAWILQARPITADLPRVAGSPARTASLIGTPGSSGTASGPARIVAGPRDFSRVRRGDILVCPYTDPAWTPLLALAAGVVTRTGGVLSHAAIVAREFAIPAVLGVPDVMEQLDDGDVVTIDGDAGTVIRGRSA